jgi:hypothetical protein
LKEIGLDPRFRRITLSNSSFLAQADASLGTQRQVLFQRTGEIILVYRYFPWLVAPLVQEGQGLRWRVRQIL